MWPGADDGPNVLPASLTAFFLVPLKREQIPVWVFNPESLADGHAGLILNMIPGEIHVLTNADLPLTSVPYDIDLLLGSWRFAVQGPGTTRVVASGHPTG